MAANTFVVRMFGKFQLERDGQHLRALEGCKAHDLLCYLLLNRQRQHPREVLAALLWGECTTAQSRKYLRQALWQIQSALGSAASYKHSASNDDRNETRKDIWDDAPGIDEGGHPAGYRLLQIDPEWVSVKHGADLWLDVADFEQAHIVAHGIPGEQMNEQTYLLLQEAVALYRGDLLEGCYHDWCLFERERFQNSYLGMLDKLISYSARHRDYEAGLDYGEIILRYNKGRERTHREMMRLRYLAGDRTGALQQYARCRDILMDELGAKPARGTVELYERMLADDLQERAAQREYSPLESNQSASRRSHVTRNWKGKRRKVAFRLGPSAHPNTSDPNNPDAPLAYLVGHLQQLCSSMELLQQQMRHDLSMIDARLHRSD